MAVSQNQRLRKAAAKAAKRKALVADKLAHERRELAISKPRHIDLAVSPLVDCKISQGYETKGMGTLCVARKLPLGRYGVCYFLLDLWCLGVKDAFFRVLDAQDYEFYGEQEERAAPTTPIAPALARKLLRGAAAYGAANGFPPPEDFAEMEGIFGDVAPAEVEFAFGHNGRPHYIIGPNDTPARVRRIMERLEFTLGFGGFDYTYPLEDDYDDDLLEGEAVEDDAEATQEAPVAPASR